MRITIIASGDFFSTYGGGQVYVKNLVDALIEKGEDVTVISVVAVSTGMEVKQYKGHDLIEIKDHTWLKKAVECASPDVIHAHSLKREACEIGKEIGIPVVVTVHHGGILCPAGALMTDKDIICEETVNHKHCLPCVLRNIPGNKAIWYPIMRHIGERRYVKLGEQLRKLPFIYFISPVGGAALSIKEKTREWKEIAELSTVVISPSDRMADAMKRNGLLESKIRVVPHGIPISKRVDSEHKGDKLKFYYVGRISYIKGLHVLVKAFSSVENPDIELHIIGEAVTKEECRYFKQLVSQSCRDKRIIWYGKVEPDKMACFTEGFHVAVAPTICLEVFGLNIAEALAQGKPVLATRCGGGEMQVEDGKNGWLVPPNDSEALAEKIRMIAQSPEQIKEMSANCKAISIESHCEQLLEIYKEVLDAEA